MAAPFCFDCFQRRAAPGHARVCRQPPLSSQVPGIHPLPSSTDARSPPPRRSRPTRYTEAEAGAAEADLSRIHAPIGLAIGGKSPWEIAVSILAEITAVTGQTPSQIYADLTDRYGDPAYERVDAPATAAQKAALAFDLENERMINELAARD